MRWTAWALAILGMCLSFAAEAARPATYGGELVAYVFGPPLNTSLHRSATAGDRTVQRALFEPLYELDPEGQLIPVLAAGLPTVEGVHVWIPLRRDARLHDRRPLTPQLVANALQDKRGTDGAHVLAPVRGFFTAPGSGGPLEIEPDPAQYGLRIELIAPYDDFPRLLASTHGQIAVPSPERRRDVGTGPFFLAAQSARGGATLAPFLHHRDGRPYLDSISLRMHASRSSASAWARRREPTILLGVPDGGRGAAAPSSWPRGGSTPPPLTRVMIRMAPGPDIDDEMAAIDTALQRNRLVTRFMDPAARATRRLLPSLPDAPAPSPVASLAPRRLDLVVSQTHRSGWQFAKRVQLDLLRAGISATLERVEPREAIRAARAPGPNLVLVSHLPDAPESSRPSDQLHALLSIASSLGVPDALAKEELVPFFTGDEALRRTLLPELEARLRRRLGLVVIAVRPPGVLLRSTSGPMAIDTQGALRFENTQRSGADK